MNTKYWLGSLALAALAVSASAQVPYSTNFESPYVIGSAGGQQNLIADENSLNFQTGLFRVNNALAFSGTQSVRFDSSLGQWGSSYLFREANFQPSGGLNKIVVSSRVFVNTGATAISSFGLEAWGSIPYITRIAALRIGADGKVEYVDANDNTVVTSQTVTPNAWNLLSMEVDLATKQATGWVNGAAVIGMSVAVPTTDVEEIGLGAMTRGNQIGYFDDLSVTIPVPARTVSGTVTLQDLADPATSSDFSATFGIYSGTTLVDTKTATLSSSGAYSFTTLITGNVQIRAKSIHWLGKLSSSVNLNSNVSGLNFSLINGDVDNDNDISILDYIKLSESYGLDTTAPNWNTPDADGVRPKDTDLDNDGEVSILDYILLSTNYGLQGDSI